MPAYYQFFLEYLAAWMILAGFQSLFFLSREPALPLRWLVRTGICAVASIILVPAGWWTLSLPGMPSSGYWVYNCYFIFPFSVTGIVVGLLQTRILSGKLIPIYLSTAWITSLIAGFVCGLIVSHFGNIDAEAGMFGPYFSTGLSIAILGGALVYFILTSTVLFIFWKK